MENSRGNHRTPIDSPAPPEGMEKPSFWKNLTDWRMSGEPLWQPTEDWHTAGEPFRIVKDLPSEVIPAGLGVCEVRKHILKTPEHPLDTLRKLLCWEPRGHADMYGGFIVPPDDAGAHFGVLFFHCDGFSTACGHGTIALGFWALEHGLVKAPESNDSVDVVIDVPSGRVVARISCIAGKAVHVDFVNVASYQIAKNVPLQVPDVLDGGKMRTFKANICFGGAVYVSVNVADLDLSIDQNHYQRFINLQGEIKKCLLDFRHEGSYEVYGVCFYEEMYETAKGITQKNVVVFADGQVDRSPCGSGTAARVAILLNEGRMHGDKILAHQSIIETTFKARILSTLPDKAGFPGCIVSVRGTANLTGRHSFYIDPREKLFPGFLPK